MTARIYERADIYLEGKRAEPKQLFVEVASRLSAQAKPGMTLLDVGCAAGEFAEYALSRFADVEVTGVDINQRLVDAARRRVPGGAFQTADANDLHVFGDCHFDAITMTGVHSIFDDFRNSFTECIRVCRSGGTVIISGLFNDYPIDMLAYWRYANEPESEFSRGYNLFSKASVSTFLDGHNRIRNFRFDKFVLPFDLAQQDDCVRSWTEKDSEGNRVLRNGLMALNFQILIIEIADDRVD